MRRFVLLLVALLLGISTASAEKKVRITFTGDVTLGGESYLQVREDSFTGYADNKGYDWFFANVIDLFREDDLTVVNLEGVLADNNSGENRDKTYRFRAMKKYVQILTDNSIELCTMANNHTGDFGAIGWQSTIKTLDKAGVGRAADKDYYILEKDGIRVAIFAFTGSSVNHLNSWYTEKIRKLREQEGVNAVIFCIHAGVEYAVNRADYQDLYAQRSVESGADLVIMHHPHVIQGINVINNRTAFYSLGNFCFGGNLKIRALDCLMVQAELTFDDDGTYLGQQMYLYPCHTSGDPEKNNFQPVRVRGEEAAAALALAQADTAFELPAFDEEKGYALMPYLPAN